MLYLLARAFGGQPDNTHTYIGSAHSTACKRGRKVIGRELGKVRDCRSAGRGDLI